MLVSNNAESQMQSLFNDIILKMSLSFFLLVNHRRKRREERRRKRKEQEKSLRENWERLEQGNGRKSFNHIQHTAYQWTNWACLEEQG